MTKRVAIFTYEDGQILDVTGPLEVFAQASSFAIAAGASEAPYKPEVIARKMGPVTMSNGLTLFAHRAYDDLDEIDTLLLTGGTADGMFQADEDKHFYDWLRGIAPRVRRLGSVCTGTYFLARAGLLSGHRATSHWLVCDRLAADYPDVEIVEDAIYIKSGNVYTSAGVSAGIDLALSLVEEDLGRDIAMKIARHLVLFLKRPGGQSQFSAQLVAQSKKTDRFDHLLIWIADHPEANLSVSALADKMAMSPRNFARLFREQVGETPAKYVERVRLDAARRRLEEYDDKIDKVASLTGFGTAETLRRTMKRHMATTPEAYRASFGG